MEQTERKPFALRDESKEFAVRCIRLYQNLTEDAEKREYNLSKQFLMAGTRIGDAVQQEEWMPAYHFAKSAMYWLELLHDGDYIADDEAEAMLQDCEKLVRYLYVVSHPESRKDNGSTPNEEGGAL